MVTPKMRMTNIRELFTGGMASLNLAITPDGVQLVVRQLLRRNLFRWRLHRGFVNGTAIRDFLSPHPNIVYSVERGYCGLVPYEVIEFVDGSSLRKLLQTRDVIVKENSLEILKQAARALGYMHQKGIMHLDVKAENILIIKQEKGIIVKLTDFDLSRAAGDVRMRYRSGTETYMAPEQLKHGQIGPAVDIFAFGVMAYNLLTGKWPFQGDTEKEKRWKQMSSKYKVVEPVRYNRDITPKLNWLVVRCLEKNPAKRIPSMAYLKQELDDV